MGDVHLGGDSERQWGGAESPSWITMGTVTFGGGPHGGRAAWASAARSVWSPQWEAVTISIVSVANCQLGTLRSFSLGLSFTLMKQRHWTCQAASGFEGHLRTDSVFGTGYGDSGGLLPLPYEEEEDVIPALVTPWSRPGATCRPSERMCWEV